MKLTQVFDKIIGVLSARGGAAPAKDSLAPAAVLADAIGQTDAAKVREAIRKGADVNFRYPNGDTFFHKIILDAGEQTQSYQDWDEEKCFDAVRLGFDNEGLMEQARRLYILRLLLEAGLDTEAKSSSGESALELAQRLGRTAFADFLGQRKHRDENTEKPQEVKPVANGSELFEAVDGLGVKWIEEIVKGGVDVNISDEDGNSALHKAVTYDNEAALTYKTLSREEVIKKGDTFPGGWPEGLLEHGRRLDMIGKLLELGANPNAANKLGETPLSLARNSENTAFASLLETADSARGKGVAKTSAWNGAEALKAAYRASGFEIAEAIPNHPASNRTPLYGYAKAFSYSNKNTRGVMIFCVREWEEPVVRAVLNYCHLLRSLAPGHELKVTSPHPLPSMLEYLISGTPSANLAIRLVMQLPVLDELSPNRATLIADLVLLVLKENIDPRLDMDQPDLIKRLDSLILAMAGDSSATGYVPLQAIMALGCLAGECMRRRWTHVGDVDVHWIDTNQETSTEPIALEIRAGDKKTIVNPIGKARKHYLNGGEDSLEGLSKYVESTLAEAKHETDRYEQRMHATIYFPEDNDDMVNLAPVQTLPVTRIGYMRYRLEETPAVTFTSKLQCGDVIEARLVIEPELPRPGHGRCWELRHTATVRRANP